jgi:uncharacterized membrane protein YeaQ/YmgE (transglycosylase-associated protein family)
MNWLYMFIIGIIVGAIARFLLPGDQSMGVLKTGLFGVGGSLIAGAVNFLLHGLPFAPGGMILSVLGAMLLLWLGQKMHKAA